MTFPSHAPGRPLAAVVDLGTNAARLAMASLGPMGELVSQGRWRELIRLGEGVARTGVLSPAAMDRGEATLRRFAALIADRRVDAMDAVATSALREASNGEEFLARAQEAGIPLRIIPAEEEARLALAGVWATLGSAPPSGAVVFDVGGGSLEIIAAEEGRPAGAASVKAGVVYLTERHLKAIPTPLEQVEACAAAVRGMLAALPVRPRAEALPLLGCGGVVALAGFMGDKGERIDGRMLSLRELEGWIPRFARLDFAGRRALPGFESGREDVALAGLIVAREVLRWSSREVFRVSTGGVREGRLRELLLECK